MLRIDKIMKMKGLSAQELSEKMHVTPQYISEVVNERKNITLSGLKKFADQLEVPLAAIFDGYQEEDEGRFSFNCPKCGQALKVGLKV